MSLLLDLGHTCAKLGEEKNGQVLRLATIPITDAPRLRAALRERQSPDEVLRAVSTMRGSEGNASREGVERAWGQPVAWASSEAARGDICLRYDRPETFGTDRLLALRAARRRTRSALIVVDAGSAVVVDGLTKDDQHCGGWIAPGYSRQKSALAILPVANRAPLVEPHGSFHPGTSEAIESGIWETLSAGVDAMCARLREDVLGESAMVMLTGGDAENLQLWCRTSMVAAPDLVLEGLAFCSG